ncbi:zinc finger protein 665-like [Haliotis asinina]|uniref:zinc finger protein 665-like n=1 Tax=Haliotis asinina TaxID=109174 RepID=UPI003531ED20
MSLDGSGESEFSIMRWTALGKEVLDMTAQREKTASSSNDEMDDRRDDTPTDQGIMYENGEFSMTDSSGFRTTDTKEVDSKGGIKDEAKMSEIPVDNGSELSLDAEIKLLYGSDEEKKPAAVRSSSVRSSLKEDSIDSVNETEASVYGETSGTDSSSNFPDSDFSDISRKRKRGHKSSSRLDNLVKKIMKRSTDLPRDKPRDKSLTTTSNEGTPDVASENSQSDADAQRLFQIRAFAEGQISCEESSLPESEESEEYEDYFVSHLHAMEDDMSSESEGNKKTEKDEDYIPTEGTDDAEAEEEVKSDDGSNYSDDDFTRLAKKKKKSKAKPFVCGVCNKDFISAKMLEGHMKCHIDPKSLTCNICGKLFDFPYKLKNHAKVHNKSFECDICGRTFSDRGGFTRHRNTHSSEKYTHGPSAKKTQSKSTVSAPVEKMKCHICGGEFECKKELSVHLSSHAGGSEDGDVVAVTTEKMKCHTCGKEFTSKDSLSQHLKTHTAIVYECDMCDKTFTQDEEYTAHLKAHDEEDDRHDDELYKCMTCGDMFQCQRELDLHQKKHTKSTFMCNTCGWTFTDERPYQAHLKSHKADEGVTWKCNKCKLEFAHKNDLREHLKKHIKRTYRCEQCGRIFTEEILYIAHLRNHKAHEDIRWKCNKCKLEFNKKEELKEHLKIHIKHTYMCDTCGETFAYESDYAAHLKKHYSDELLKCNFCELKFVSRIDLTDHLKTHVMELQICVTCGETFTDQAKYLKHIKFHKAMLRCRKCGIVFPCRSDLELHMKTHVQHIYVCETCSDTFTNDKEYTEHLKTHSTTQEEDDADDLPVIVIS